MIQKNAYTNYYSCKYMINLNALTLNKCTGCKKWSKQYPFFPYVVLITHLLAEHNYHIPIGCYGCVKIVPKKWDAFRKEAHLLTKLERIC